MVAQEVATPRTFAKPQEARRVEARARAKQLGVRVAVVSEARSYVSASQSTPGSTYRIERNRHGWACECDGYRFTGMCKHIAQVQRRSEREGWAFGQVCPLPRAEQPANVVPFRQPMTAAHRAEIARDLYGD
jgi:hypothetical protein